MPRLNVVRVWHVREVKGAGVISVTPLGWAGAGECPSVPNITLNVFLSRLQIGDMPNPELRIITSVFGKVQYKGESIFCLLRSNFARRIDYL